MKKPKIVLFDLETSHNTALIFDLYPNFVPHENIVKERFIFCVAWKELGGKINSMRLTSKQAKAGDDAALVAGLREVLVTADAVVAHYGDKFDMPMFNARLIKHGFSPIPDIIQIDTKKMASRKFRFNSNRLDYLGRYLGVGKKIKTSNELWLRCLEGDDKALAKMERYNKGDVLLLERVFKKLSPYLPTKVNHRLFDVRAACSRCGSTRIQYRGIKYKAGRKYRGYYCKSCTGWGHEPKAIKE